MSVGVTCDMVIAAPAGTAIIRLKLATSTRAIKTLKIFLLTKLLYSILLLWFHYWLGTIQVTIKDSGSKPPSSHKAGDTMITFDILLVCSPYSSALA
jgi:hypothetical protein